MFVSFFFKQKTAYEMRISDWSSDVCSSDLLMFMAMAGDWRTRSLIATLPSQAAGLVRFAFILAVPAAIFPALFALPRRVGVRATLLAVQIGRASCRERV